MGAANQTGRDGPGQKEKDMKKVVFLAIIALVFGSLSIALAQTWHNQAQVTVAWDAVTTYQNGTAISSDEVVAYQLFAEDVDSSAGRFMVGETRDTQYTISFESEGSYLLGVRAVRKDGNGTVLSRSSIVWSDNATEVANGETFGVRYYEQPASCSGFRMQ